MTANTKILLILVLVVLCTAPVNAGLFSLNERVDPPFFGCSILGCTMQGNIDMGGYSITNVNIVNATMVTYVNFSQYTNNSNIEIYYSQILDPPIYLSNFSNDQGFINETWANQTYYPLNSNPLNYVNDSSGLSVNYSEFTNNLNIFINYSQINNTPFIPEYFSDLNNDIGLINETFANQTYYPLNSNPLNYINDSSGLSVNYSEYTNNDNVQINYTQVNNIQFFNDTQFVIDALVNYYNISDIDALLVDKLNTSDQRYNDTQFVLDQLINYYNISDIDALLLNYYNTTQIDELFANYTWNETDPIFSAENTSIWNAINDKLNITDQRYNDTLLINSTNESIWIELNNKLNTSDQRYNDTQFILDELANYYNMTESDNRYLQNYTETDPIFSLENTTIWNAINDKYNSSNPSGYINETFANQTYYLNTNPDNYINDTTSITINYSQITNTPTNLSEFNNDIGLINETYANQTYYPLNSNPAGYLNESNFNSSNLTGPWVLKAGDTMTGNLNMSNTNITDVDVLFVHNITGRSPIFVSSPIISYENITAATFYGNINGVNGTIFGMTITNGTIENMHVSGSAIFNTSLIPELNDTWSLGNESNQWRNFYVGDLYAVNISSPDIDNLYNLIYSVNNSSVNNFTNTNTAYNVTLIITLNDGSTLTTTFPYPPPYNDSAIWQELNNKLNTSDQRYNDTQFIINELINYYNMSESDARYLQNFTETDPIFSAENFTIWNAINIKLNESDQRYNDTQYIINSLLDYYNKTDSDARYLQNYTETDPVFSAENSTIWNAINNKLNISDQRYNDTLLINSTNESIWLELNIKLNESDQRYNDTQFVLNELLNYYNKTDSDNRYLQNYTETDPIFSLENTTIWNAINLKLNISDQRYNETQLILDVNATIKQPSGPYLANNTTSFWVDETNLNLTINNISKIRTIIINLTCTTTGGTCNNISNSITHEITRIIVTPTTPNNNYRFQLTEYPTTTIIDKDRTPHVGTWDIEKNYAINGQVQGTITNANIDELFTMSITYLTNGVTP